MRQIQSPQRRVFILGAAAVAFGSLASEASSAAASPNIAIYRNPGCGCCEKWADHLRAAGYTTQVADHDDLDGLRAKLGVPAALAGCHTATVGGYVVEGHVPAAAIDRLLRERPKAVGVAVAGMPVGSPGMEGGTAEVYEAILFGEGLQQSYGRFKGAQEIE